MAREEKNCNLQSAKNKCYEIIDLLEKDSFLSRLEFGLSKKALLNEIFPLGDLTCRRSEFLINLVQKVIDCESLDKIQSVKNILEEFEEENLPFMRLKAINMLKETKEEKCSREDLEYISRLLVSKVQEYITQKQYIMLLICNVKTCMSLKRLQDVIKVLRY